MGYILLLIVWVYLLSNFCGGLRKHVCNATVRTIAVQVNSGSSKVVDFGTNRNRVYDFLLVISSNLGPILHRFGDTAIYCDGLSVTSQQQKQSTSGSV